MKTPNPLQLGLGMGRIVQSIKAIIHGMKGNVNLCDPLDEQ